VQQRKTEFAIAPGREKLPATLRRSRGTRRKGHAQPEGAEMPGATCGMCGPEKGRASSGLRCKYQNRGARTPTGITERIARGPDEKESGGENI